MKGLHVLLSAALVFGSLFLASCSSQDSSTPATEGETPAAEVTLATNTSASAEEVTNNFMNAIVEGGYDQAKAYVAPDQRDASPLLSTWAGSLKISKFSNVQANPAFGGLTNVKFHMEGAWGENPYAADGGIDTAEIDGVWWVVPYNYQAK